MPDFVDYGDDARDELLMQTTMLWHSVPDQMRTINADILSGVPGAMDRYLDDGRLQIAMREFHSALIAHISNGT